MCVSLACCFFCVLRCFVFVLCIVSCVVCFDLFFRIVTYVYICVVFVFAFVYVYVLLLVCKFVLSYWLRCVVDVFVVIMNNTTLYVVVIDVFCLSFIYRFYFVSVRTCVGFCVVCCIHMCMLFLCMFCVVRLYVYMLRVFD